MPWEPQADGTLQLKDAGGNLIGTASASGDGTGYCFVVEDVPPLRADLDPALANTTLYPGHMPGAVMSYPSKARSRDEAERIVKTVRANAGL